MNKLVNFRCIGGAAALDGRRVKKGLLLRSGQLYKLLEEDATRLKDHGIGIIIDLRTAPEIAGAPNDEIAGARYVNIDIMANVTERFLNRNEWIKALNPEQAVDGMLLVYKAFTADAVARRGFADFLRTLADAEGPVLFHCYAGKDRTGFAAALILKILGVSWEYTLKDYLLTIEERREYNSKYIEEYRKKGLSEEQLAGLEIAYSVQADFLESAFEAIDRDFGDFDNFLTEGLGLDEALIQKLREKYLEPSPEL
ncbi:MAG: tyrosine-protein phosphatase [Clostridiales bacterium]|nr:tyrosine-protein phosphatase [Clostridiales bacterium]